eukprot:3021149-Prymnesium_polylepis.1
MTGVRIPVRAGRWMHSPSWGTSRRMARAHSSARCRGSSRRRSRTLSSRRCRHAAVPPRSRNVAAATPPQRRNTRSPPAPRAFARTLLPQHDD